jgi:D-sedoheptulose 7-phosphate isomerase
MAMTRGSDVRKLAVASLKDSARVKLSLARTHGRQFERAAAMLLAALRSGRTIFFLGNGGSAADAQHLATEFTGRFLRPGRRALPAIALTTDTSALTAIANDYGYAKVFSRQLEALARHGDVVVAISTSGKSPSVLRAVRAAREAGAGVIGLTGSRGQTLASVCDVAFVVPASTSPRIQESHITIGHILCHVIDDAFAGE